LSGGSDRNIWGSGTQDLFSLGNGIYEKYENNYSQEIINEIDKKDKNDIVEQKILSNNESLKQLISSLEKKNGSNKETNED